MPAPIGSSPAAWTPGVQGDALLFAHGHLLRILAARWLRQPADAGRTLGLDTATIGVLGWDRANRCIERWNDADATRPGARL